jgi:hypothetical protein
MKKKLHLQRHLFILLLLLLLSNKKYKRNNYQLNIDSLKYESVKNNKYLIVTVTLKNNSNDTLKYLSRICDWQGIYQLKSESLKWADSLNCEKDYITFIKLPPFASKSVSLKLEFLNNYKIPIKFRVGIVLIKDEKQNGMKYLFNEQVDSILVWSKPKIWLPSKSF